MGLLLNIEPGVLHHKVRDRMYFTGTPARVECYIKTAWVNDFMPMGLPSMMQMVVQQYNIAVPAQMQTHAPSDENWYHPALSFVKFRSELLPYYLAVVREWKAAVKWRELSEGARVKLLQEFELRVVQEHMVSCTGRKLCVVREEW